MHYLDTSFLTPYFIPEPTSSRVDQLLRSLQFETMVISPWVRMEFASLLARRSRMREISVSDSRKIFALFEQIIKDGPIQVVSIDIEDYQESAVWILNAPIPIRAPDALHLGISKRLQATSGHWIKKWQMRPDGWIFKSGTLTHNHRRNMMSGTTFP